MNRYRAQQTALAAAVLVLACIAIPSVVWSELAAQDLSSEEGFTDTPYLPGGKWHVHDPDRPKPHVITPGTCSSQDTPGRAPSDAVVLFDGRNLTNWLRAGEGQQEPSEPAPWKVENGYMEVVPGAGGIVSKQKFGDCQIHLEWAAPTEITGSSQGRGNSGVLIMGQYEIQVLDSSGNVTYADGQAGAMYGQYPPLVNASRRPGEWQTYDIIFEAPRFEGETVAKPAYVTVLHNGVVLHHRQAFIGSVVWRQVAKYRPHPAEGPLMLQEHGNKVRYRNIWVRPLGQYDQP